MNAEVVGGCDLAAVALRCRAAVGVAITAAAEKHLYVDVGARGVCGCVRRMCGGVGQIVLRPTVHFRQAAQVPTFGAPRLHTRIRCHLAFQRGAGGKVIGEGHIGIGQARGAARAGFAATATYRLRINARSVATKGGDGGVVGGVHRAAIARCATAAGEGENFFEVAVRALCRAACAQAAATANALRKDAVAAVADGEDVALVGDDDIATGRTFSTITAKLQRKGAAGGRFLAEEIGVVLAGATGTATATDTLREDAVGAVAQRPDQRIGTVIHGDLARRAAFTALAAERHADSDVRALADARPDRHRAGVAAVAATAGDTLREDAVRASAGRHDHLRVVRGDIAAGRTIAAVATDGGIDFQ